MRKEIVRNITLGGLVIILGASLGLGLAKIVKAGGAYIISGSYTINGFDVNLSGTASANPYVGNLGQQHVSVDCGINGDTIPNNWIDADTFNITDSGGQGNNKWFNGSWSHTCTFIDPGSYTIFVRVHHGNVNGAEGSDVATYRADITLKKYSCNTSTWTCEEDEEGQYSSEAECEASCHEETPPTGGGIITGTGPTGVVLGAATERGQVAGAQCELYLLSYIKLGADNDPEEVKKLESFLNEYLGLDLPIDGIYDYKDFQAVKQFQLAMKDKILAPWVEIGCLPNVDTPTGYVYKTTKWAINSFFCPELYPDLSNEKCEGLGLEGVVGQTTATGGEVLGEQIAQAEETAPTEETTETTGPAETTETTTAEGEAVTLAKSQDWIWAIVIVAVLGGAGYFLFFKKKS